MYLSIFRGLNVRVPVLRSVFNVQRLAFDVQGQGRLICAICVICGFSPQKIIIRRLRRSQIKVIGVGKWRQWTYLLVFLSIPLSLFGYILLDGSGIGGKLTPGIAVGAFVFFVLYIVRNKSIRRSEE